MTLIENGGSGSLTAFSDSTDSRGFAWSCLTAHSKTISWGAPATPHAGKKTPSQKCEGVVQTEQCCYRRRLFFVGRKAAAKVLRAGNGFCNSGRAEAVPLPQVALAGGTPVPPPYSYAPASIAPMVLRPSAHAG